MKDINLISQKQKELEGKAKQMFYFQMFSFSLLAIYGLLVAGMFGYYFILNRQSKLLSRNISNQGGEIESLVDVETKQFYLKRKIANLEEIIKSSAEHHDLIEGFLAMLPETVEVEGFSISEEKEIDFNGTTISFKAMEELFANIGQGSLSNHKIYAAAVNSVDYSEDEYSFSVQLNLEPVKPADEEVQPI